MILPSICVGISSIDYCFMRNNDGFVTLLKNGKYDNAQIIATIVNV